MTVMLLAYDIPAFHSEVKRWLDGTFESHTLCTRVQKSLILLDFIEDMTAEDAMRSFLAFWRAPTPGESFAFFDLSGGTHAIAGPVGYDLKEFIEHSSLPVVRLADASAKAVDLVPFGPGFP